MTSPSSRRTRGVPALRSAPGLPCEWRCPYCGALVARSIDSVVLGPCTELVDKRARHIGERDGLPLFGLPRRDRIGQTARHPGRDPSTRYRLDNLTGSSRDAISEPALATWCLRSCGKAVQITL